MSEVSIRKSAVASLANDNDIVLHFESVPAVSRSVVVPRRVAVRPVSPPKMTRSVVVARRKLTTGSMSTPELPPNVTEPSLRHSATAPSSPEKPSDYNRKRKNSLDDPLEGAAAPSDPTYYGVESDASRHARLARAIINGAASDAAINFDYQDELRRNREALADSESRVTSTTQHKEWVAAATQLTASEEPARDDESDSDDDVVTAQQRKQQKHLGRRRESNARRARTTKILPDEEASDHIEYAPTTTSITSADFVQRDATIETVDEAAARVNVFFTLEDKSLVDKRHDAALVMTKQLLQGKVEPTEENIEVALFDEKPIDIHVTSSRTDPNAMTVLFANVHVDNDATPDERAEAASRALALMGHEHGMAAAKPLQPVAYDHGAVRRKVVDVLQSYERNGVYDTLEMSFTGASDVVTANGLVESATVSHSVASLSTEAVLRRLFKGQVRELIPESARHDLLSRLNRTTIQHIPNTLTPQPSDEFRVTKLVCITRDMMMAHCREVDTTVRYERPCIHATMGRCEGQNIPGTASIALKEFLPEKLLRMAVANPLLTMPETRYRCLMCLFRCATEYYFAQVSSCEVNRHDAYIANFYVLIGPGEFSALQTIYSSSRQHAGALLPILHYCKRLFTQERDTRGLLFFKPTYYKMPTPASVDFFVTGLGSPKVRAQMRLPAHATTRVHGGLAL